MSLIDPNEWPLEDLVRFYPWNYIGPTKCRDDDGNEYYELYIKELSDFFLAGTDRQSVLEEIKPALGAFLRSYRDRGERVPGLRPSMKSWAFTPGPMGQGEFDTPPMRPALPSKAESGSIHGKIDLVTV